MLSLHHLHLRERVYKDLEPYPHPEKNKRLADRLVYIACVLTPIMTLPQIYDIWANHSASGVSVPAWSYYAIASVVWLWYGILHKDKALISLNASMIILNGLVAFGAFLFR
jgi:uncharacterized protein with PQ loop repeat